MPELPEVQTTVNGIKKHVVGHTIKEVWSDYDSAYFRGKDDVRDKKYFAKFKREILGKKIIATERRAKNILMHLSGGKTILIHMKMTGHLLYGSYKYKKQNPTPKTSPWIPVSPTSLKDPFNRHIHFVITFENGYRLALCDSRKFAKVTLLETVSAHDTKHLSDIGPEPLHRDFTFEVFISRINMRANKPIKITLMDQRVIAGIGNIYADESLWRADIHPESIVRSVHVPSLKNLFNAIKFTLSKGIDLGGDSMSDYRNILGERGKFQENHMAYQRKGEKCQKRGCRGTIERIVVGTRGTHFCRNHQKLHK